MSLATTLPLRARSQARTKVAEMWRHLAEQEDAPVMQIIPQENITEKKAEEQAVDITVPHEEVVDIAQITPQTSVKNRTAEQNVDIPVPPLKEDFVKVGQITPHERDQEQMAEQSVNIPVPPIMEERKNIAKRRRLWTSSTETTQRLTLSS